ncbi:MAG: Response regulator SaeR [Bacteroidetes bacterium ADurb.Bin217]|nr:MAG: Response regulator SaeR [Bacteroidetes bacterium ADurb.Bin217]
MIRPSIMTMKLQFCFSFLVIFVQSLCAQTEYALHHYSRSQGMTDSYITGITEDSTGKMWISTAFGVNVFDGSHFEQYTVEESQYHNLIRNDIQTVYSDKSNRIWIAGFNGTIQTYNAKFDRFDNISLNHVTLDEYPSFTKLYQHSSSELYGMSSKGLYRYSKYSGKFHKAFRELHELHSTLTICMHIDNTGNMILGTQKQGIIIVSSDSTKITKIPILPYVAEQPRINCMLQKTDSSYYIGTSRGLMYLVVPRKGTPSIVPIFEEISGDFISSLCYDGKGNVWIGTGYRGVWIYTPKHTLQQLPISAEQAAENSGVTTLFKDSHNRMWIGTPGNGLFMYNPIETYITHISKSKGLSCPIVSATITDEQGNIWIGTDGGGIHIYSKDMKHTKHLHAANGLPSDAVLCFAQSPTHMWISTWRGGIGSIHKKTFEIRVYNKDNSSLVSNGIKSIAWYAPDTLVIGNHGEGLQFFNTKTNTCITDFSITYSSYFPEEQKYITQVVVDSKKNIWVATIRNLYCVTGKKVKDVLESDIFSHPQNPLFVSSISFDKAGFIIAATNKGVFRINIQTFEVQTILETHQYLSQAVNLTVHAASPHQYWIANTKGLFMYNPLNKTIQKCVISSDANRLFFVPRAIYSDAQGMLYIGSHQGMYKCNTRTMFARKKQIHIEFAQLYIHHQKVIPGASILEQALSHTNHIEIPYTTGNKSISFRTIHYEFPQSIECAYRFEGLDTMWHELGTLREIDCNHLKPGTYMLTVKAWQNNVDSAVQTSIRITILPPWWKTWWFILLATGAGILLLWLAHTLRMYRLQRERNELQKKVNTQLDAVQKQKDIIEEQHNELQFVSEKLEESNSVLLLQKQELEELTKQLQEESIEISQLNAWLKQTNITKEQLFIMITNDITQAFESLGTLAQKLQSHIAADSHKRPLISAISSNIQHHKELLKNLILWAKNQSNSIDVTMQEISLSECIDEFIASCKSIVFEKNCTINYKNKDAQTIYADKQLLLISLRNIVYAMLQGIPSGSFILLSTETKKDVIKLTLHANIESIDNSLRNSLLINKKSTDNKKAYSIDSQNLHIIVSKQCIVKNNGTLSVTHSKNSGLEYSITLPTHAPITENIVHTETHTTKHIHVVIVDDNPAIVKLCEGYLSQKYRVTTYTDSKELLDSIDSIAADVVISDIMMPEVDGYNVCKIIKEKYRIPVILISSSREDTIKQYAYQCGADAYIDKPIHKDVLLAVIQNIENHWQPDNVTQLTPEFEPDNDAVFLKKFETLLSQNIANSEISIEDIALQMNVSRTQLFRKIKQIHAMSPKEYLIKMRMHTAGELLQSGEHKIIDVAYAVGFSDPSYFTKCFIKFYGISPSEYKG